MCYWWNDADIRMKSVLLILLVDGVLLSFAGLFAHDGRHAPALSILAATALLMVWQLVLFVCLPDPARHLSVERVVTKPHVIQAVLQTCLFVYWGLYWNDVRDYAPLIVVQLSFAYGFDMLWSWSRYRVWRAGWGPIPIVLSLNLFLWMKEDFFFLQFVLIMLTWLGKELVRWKRGQHTTHIVNPSAFSLALMSVLMLSTDTLGVTRGADLVTSFLLPPNFYEVVFLLGVVGQLLFLTTLVTLGAAVSQYLLYLAATALVGIALTPHPIDEAVFLGLTLLVTDPATSPKTNMGKLLFGVTYGCGVFFLFVLLRLSQQPAFVDKILMVPVVNLLVPTFDKLGNSFHKWYEQYRRGRSWRHDRFVWTGLYAAFFISILPALKTLETRPAVLPEPVLQHSPDTSRLIALNAFCRRMLPQPFEPFGFHGEVLQFHAIKRIYEQDPQDILQELGPPPAGDKNFLQPAHDSAAEE